MDWIERLNQSIEYIEKRLDGEIRYDEISRITACPVSLYQRFFVLATGITLAEYIRRRKLSRAARDLRKTRLKVIDIAAKYGYESPDAFCAAFKRLYGVTPSRARKSGSVLKEYCRIFFTLTITHIKGDGDMVLLNIDGYRYYGPLFEGARIVMTYLGGKYSPEYIQGISGAAFKIAGGCPSRPTCVYDMWTPDFIRFMGYEIEEFPCFDGEGGDVTARMIEAVKRHIDGGRPALVWNAFTSAEWDVVCGYDGDAGQFIGRGICRGAEDYHREPWDRARECDGYPAFGAILIGDKVSEPNEREAEISSLVNAVRHAGKEKGENGEEWPKYGLQTEGIAFYRRWAEVYSKEGAERDLADAYCYDVYSSVRKAAVVYLREISHKYDGGAPENMLLAADCFEKEAEELEKARPYLSWDSPWGVDEERSKNLAPVLKAAAGYYEEGMGYLEKAVGCMGVEI